MAPGRILGTFGDFRGSVRTYIYILYIYVIWGRFWDHFPGTLSGISKNEKFDIGFYITEFHFIS